MTTRVVHLRESFDTVWAQVELSPGGLLDLTFVPLKPVRNPNFWVQPVPMSARLDRALLTSIRVKGEEQLTTGNDAPPLAAFSEVMPALCIASLMPGDRFTLGLANPLGEPPLTVRVWFGESHHVLKASYEPR